MKVVEPSPDQHKTAHLKCAVPLTLRLVLVLRLHLRWSTGPNPGRSVTRARGLYESSQQTSV